MALTCRVRVGCDTRKDRAALLRLPCSTTAKKYWIFRRSMNPLRCSCIRLLNRTYGKNSIDACDGHCYTFLNSKYPGAHHAILSPPDRNVREHHAVFCSECE